MCRFRIVGGREFFHGNKSVPPVQSPGRFPPLHRLTITAPVGAGLAESAEWGQCAKARSQETVTSSNRFGCFTCLHVYRIQYLYTNYLIQPHCVIKNKYIYTYEHGLFILHRKILHQIL